MDHLDLLGQLVLKDFPGLPVDQDPQALRGQLDRRALQVRRVPSVPRVRRVLLGLQVLRVPLGLLGRLIQRLAVRVSFRRVVPLEKLCAHSVYLH